MHDVFVSYASPDRAMAEALCHALEADGIRVWIAPRDVDPGMPYARCIIEAINASSLMLLVFSAATNDSEHVAREVELAARARKSLLPVRVETVEPHPELMYFLGRAHWLDVVPPGTQREHQRVVSAVRKLIARGGSKVVGNAPPKASDEQAAAPMPLAPAPRITPPPLDDEAPTPSAARTPPLEDLTPSKPAPTHSLRTDADATTLAPAIDLTSPAEPPPAMAQPASPQPREPETFAPVAEQQPPSNNPPAPAPRRSSRTRILTWVGSAAALALLVGLLVLSSKSREREAQRLAQVQFEEEQRKAAEDKVRQEAEARQAEAARAKQASIGAAIANVRTALQGDDTAKMDRALSDLAQLAPNDERVAAMQGLVQVAKDRVAEAARLKQMAEEARKLKEQREAEDARQAAAKKKADEAAAAKQRAADSAILSLQQSLAMESTEAIDRDLRQAELDASDDPRMTELRKQALTARARLEATAAETAAAEARRVAEEKRVADEARRAADHKQMQDALVASLRKEADNAFARGEELRIKDDLRNAIKEYDFAAQKFAAISEAGMQARSLYSKGRCAWSLDDADVAIPALRESAKLFLVAGKRNEYASALKADAEASVDLAVNKIPYGESIDKIKAAIDVFAEVGETGEIADSLTIQARFTVDRFELLGGRPEDHGWEAFLDKEVIPLLRRAQEINRKKATAEVNFYDSFLKPEDNEHVIETQELILDVVKDQLVCYDPFVIGFTRARAERASVYKASISWLKDHSKFDYACGRLMLDEAMAEFLRADDASVTAFMSRRELSNLWESLAARFADAAVKFSQTLADTNGGNCVESRRHLSQALLFQARSQAQNLKKNIGTAQRQLLRRAKDEAALAGDTDVAAEASSWLE